MLTKRDVALIVLIWVAILLLVALMAWHAAAQATLTLTGEKPVFIFGEEPVILFVSGQGYPEGTLTLEMIIDEELGNGFERNALEDRIQLDGPKFSFRYVWHPDKLGNYTAYLTGPDHTVSEFVTFTVVEPFLVPEFPSLSAVWFLDAALFGAFAFLLYRRKKRHARA